MKKGIPILFVLLFCVLCAACTNPFAPKLGKPTSESSLLGDQHTVDGVFKNFRYAYIFKDTLIYGQLIANNFTFIYHDYEKGVDNSWGRDDEMRTAEGLFRSAQSLELIWNDVINSYGDSLSLNVSRGFNLTITFNPADIIHVDGRVSLIIERPNIGEVWKIRQWRDESSF